MQHDLFAGGQSRVLRRELIDRGQAVAVLPYDPERDEIVLIEQFRIGAGQDENGPWVMEIIAGYQEPGESAKEVAFREAFEEAGGIEEVDDEIPVFELQDGGADGDAALLFELHPVGSRRSLILPSRHAACQIQSPAVEQEFLRQRGLTRIWMGDDGKRPAAFHLALQRGRGNGIRRSGHENGPQG